MDDLTFGSVARADWYAGQTKDESKRRARQPHTEPPEEPVDQVVLSSEVGGEPEQTEDEPG